MNGEQIEDKAKLDSAYRVYEKLWAEANKELNKSQQEWNKLQDRLAEAKMMEFAAGGDENVLLPEEELLLEEMNQKLETVQKSINFWSKRVEKLRQYRDKVQSFYARLETDIEMHKLRLSLSRAFTESQSTDGRKPNNGRRVRLY